MVATHVLPCLPFVILTMAQALQEPIARESSDGLPITTGIVGPSNPSPLISFENVQLTFLPMSPNSPNRGNSKDPAASLQSGTAKHIGVFGTPIPQKLTGSWQVRTSTLLGPHITILTLTSKGTYRLQTFRCEERRATLVQTASGEFSVVENVMAAQPDKGAGVYMHIRFDDHELYLQDYGVPFDTKKAAVFRKRNEVATPSN